MSSYTQADLEQLAAGKHVSPDAFRAILADRDALMELAKLVQGQELFGPPMPRSDIDSAELPVMDVSFAELAQFVDGTLLDPDREAAALAFLNAEFPEACPSFLIRLWRAIKASLSSLSSNVAGLFSNLWRAIPTGYGKPAGILAGFAAGFLVQLGISINESRTRADQWRKELQAKEEQNQHLRVGMESKELENQELQEGMQGVQLAESAGPMTPERFRAEFRRALGYRLKNYDGKPGRLSLVFTPLIRPPYFMGLQVFWTEASEPKLVYYAERMPLDPVYTHDFTDQLPTTGERRITILLRFHTTGEAMSMLGVGPVIEERIPLILSPNGIRISSESDGNLVAASIVQPKDGHEVREHFLLDLTLRRPAEGLQPKSNGIVHVLIRPKDGYRKWQEQYLVVPFRQSVSQLPEGEKRFAIWVSLRGILNTVPVKEKLPTRFEVLVVELPFELQAWTVSRDLMNLKEPGRPSVVRTYCEVVLKTDQIDE